MEDLKAAGQMAKVWEVEEAMTLSTGNRIEPGWYYWLLPEAPQGPFPSRGEAIATLREAVR